METITVTAKSVKAEGTGKNNKPYKIYSFTLSDDRKAEGFPDLPMNTPVNVEMHHDDKYGLKIDKHLKDTDSTKGRTVTAKLETAPANNKAIAIQVSARIIAGGQLPVRNLFTLADKVVEYLEGKTPSEKEMM